MVIDIVLLVSFILCWASVLRYDLQMLQQNGYMADRFWRWWKLNFLGNRRLLVLLSAVFLPFVGKFWAVSALAIVWLYCAYKEFTTVYKIKIVYTPRLQRLIVTTIILGLIAMFVGYELGGRGAVIVAALAVMVLDKPLCLLANIINSPIEKAVSRWYYNDAKKRLEQHPGLIIIGITGSYGKTSTKNYLYRMLSEKYNTLITPGNYNTTMGVVRTIREKLEPYHEVFIVEMGAKQTGDIKEICDLVHPSIGIVTSVGEMHLETFKSVENIQATKFELIDALPENGLGVINMDSEFIASYKFKSRCPVLGYGIESAKADCRASGIEYSAQGTRFEILRAGSALKVQTSLVGAGNILNITGASLVAEELGVVGKKLQTAIAKLQQVEHRLSVRLNGGVTVLDDAYNSNPQGARMALSVMKGMAVPEGRLRIIVTPGFVEMGQNQQKANYGLGEDAAAVVDKLIVVNKVNRKAIHDGALSAGMKEENIICVDTLQEAVRELALISGPGDVVLYENDLPDTFK